jgi:Terminase small subunit
MPPLDNARHEAFARAMVEGHSATDAYVAAGYESAGAAQHASRLVTNGKVAARIAELKNEAASDAVMAAQEALERITARARDDAEGHEGLQLRALELMGKHHKLFTERHEHDFVGGIAERLTAALERIGDTNGKDREADTVADEQVRPRRKARARGARPAKR